MHMAANGGTEYVQWKLDNRQEAFEYPLSEIKHSVCEVSNRAQS